ncbi:MAG: glycosyltransferase family 39 protein, partial [Actinomycetota bacterium]|nr:glycosyltransferase family 39 protein [Actinomycetota bacterium]
MSTSEYPANRLRGSWRPRLRALAVSRPIPADVWAVWALLALAVVIRLLTIDNQSFWTDEALTAYEAHLPFGAMINTVTHVETTPPLYFVLIWAWAHVFGIGEVALRSISTLAGVAVVGIAYLATRELISRWAGVVAAALVTVNPFMIWFSQEARSYMLLAALTGASFLWFVRALREPSRRNLSWWAAFSALSVMTHFFAGFLVAPEALWLLWSARSRIALVAVGAVGVAQLAMLPLAVADTGHGAGWVGQTSQLHRVSRTVAEWGVSILLRRVTVLQGLLAAVALVVAGGLLVGLGGGRRLQRGAAIAAALAA